MTTAPAGGRRAAASSPREDVAPGGRAGPGLAVPVGIPPRFSPPPPQPPGIPGGPVSIPGRALPRETRDTRRECVELPVRRGGVFAGQAELGWSLGKNQRAEPEDWLRGEGGKRKRKQHAGLSPGLPGRAHRYPDRQTPGLAGGQETLQPEVAEPGTDHPPEDQRGHPGHAREPGDQAAALRGLPALLPLPEDRGDPQGHRALHQEPLRALLVPAHEGLAGDRVPLREGQHLPGRACQPPGTQHQLRDPLPEEADQPVPAGPAGLRPPGRGVSAGSCRAEGALLRLLQAGDNVQQELLALVKDLPSLLSEVGAGASALSEAIDLYQACVEFVCESSTEEVVPLLRYVGQKGNTSVYEWRTGQQPLRLERAEGHRVPEQPQEDTIDWGDFTLEPPKVGEGSDGGAPGEEIDWGITVEPSTQGEGIDWGDAGGEEAQITVLEAGTEAPEGVARGSDALTLLENSQTRGQFIDELMELELFLAQRLLEMEEEADVVAVSQFQLAPPVLQGQTSARVGSMLGSARALLGRLCTRSMRHLFMILASPRYVGRVSELLGQKLRQAELLLAKKEALGRRRREALGEQAALEPRLDRLLERTEELRALIQGDISKRYGGRPVNLMGVSV